MLTKFLIPSGCSDARVSGLRRILLAGFALLLIPAGPASAHSADNTPSSNYVTEIVSVKPSKPSARPGFRLRSIEAGSRLELRWLAGEEVQVPDYDGRPYLRVGPNGVFQNSQSYATYLNADRNGSTKIPEEVNPDGNPVWKRLGSEPVARWHDHRAHRMGGDPPGVVEEPDKGQVVQEEDVTFVQGATTWTARTRVSWRPGPSSVPYLLGGLFGAAALAAAGIVLGRRSARMAGGLVTTLLAVLIVVDVFHLGGIAFGVRGTVGQSLGRLVSIGFGSIAAWVAGMVALVMLGRRRVDGHYLATFSAGLITVVGGLADLGVLSKSSVPFAFSATAARLAVTATVALGVAVVVIAIASTRPTPTATET